MVEEGKFKNQKFNGKNYQHWKMQIEDYMYQKDLCLPLGIAKQSTSMWEQGMKEEMDSLAQNQTCDLVHSPTNKKALQNKWVYKVKEESGGKKRYKAGLVVKGFAQKKGL